MAAPALSKVEIVECDEAGNVTCSYVESSGGFTQRSRKEGKARLDLPQETKSYAQQALDVFLPAGYPHSVTEDYIYYQIYDSLQAFSSSIAGLLSSRAVLEGRIDPLCATHHDRFPSRPSMYLSRAACVGVGDSTASPTSALLLSVLQDSLGRIATILFAHRVGTALEPECKMYRLLADVFNDVAIVLDCLSPAFPKPIRVGVLAGSSILRSLCGVCAGATKGCLSGHFARRGNLGEVNAKDSSQETVISLLGMLAGSLLVSHITTPLTTWTTLLFLLGVHLATNYFAVTSVNLCTLNRQRANILFNHIIHNSNVLTPHEVSKQERIFERDGIIRAIDGKCIGWAQIGVGLGDLVSSLGDVGLSALVEIFQDEGYLLCYSFDHSVDICNVVIVMKDESGTTDQLQAWVQALLLAQGFEGKEKPQSNAALGSKLEMLKTTRNKSKTLLRSYMDLMQGKGWDLDAAVLETKSGIRVRVKSD
ncbi:DUF647-domain-containing protein [Amniculicola lignicola CBS 123094]|uniref:DUF647-domain-containing protein n=1 Tax=Amniculicola lignicola CBS 123094 TaxID=1392246 RepID=A0A6A5WSV4_9PLEO|nr:DUF647-domain-containing protein [Amniculicola lignicola CBS 123094]